MCCFKAVIAQPQTLEGQSKIQMMRISAWLYLKNKKLPLGVWVSGPGDLGQTSLNL